MHVGCKNPEHYLIKIFFKLQSTLFLQSKTLIRLSVLGSLEATIARGSSGSLSGRLLGMSGKGEALKNSQGLGVKKTEKQA